MSMPITASDNRIMPPKTSQGRYAGSPPSARRMDQLKAQPDGHHHEHEAQHDECHGWRPLAGGWYSATFHSRSGQKRFPVPLPPRETAAQTRAPRSGRSCRPGNRRPSAAARRFGCAGRIARSSAQGSIHNRRTWPRNRPWASRRWAITSRCRYTRSLKNDSSSCFCSASSGAATSTTGDAPGRQRAVDIAGRQPPAGAFQQIAHLPVDQLVEHGPPQRVAFEARGARAHAPGCLGPQRGRQQLVERDQAQLQRVVGIVRVVGDAVGRLDHLRLQQRAAGRSVVRDPPVLAFEHLAREIQAREIG